MKRKADGFAAALCPERSRKTREKRVFSRSECLFCACFVAFVCCSDVFSRHWNNF